MFPPDVVKIICRKKDTMEVRMFLESLSSLTKETSVSLPKKFILTLGKGMLDGAIISVPASIITAGLAVWNNDHTTIRFEDVGSHIRNRTPVILKFTCASTIASCILYHFWKSYNIRRIFVKNLSWTSIVGKIINNTLYGIGISLSCHAFRLGFHAIRLAYSNEIEYNTVGRNFCCGVVQTRTSGLVVFGSFVISTFGLLCLDFLEKETEEKDLIDLTPIK